MPPTNWKFFEEANNTTSKKCKKLRSDNTFCHKKSYKDGRCFPHWNRTVPKWQIYRWNYEYFQKLGPTEFHRCPDGKTCYLHDLTPKQKRTA